MSTTDLYVIWSHEHDMWWGPNHCGYTQHLDRAGRYTAKQAADITLNHIPPGEEVAVQSSVAEANTAGILRMLKLRMSA